MADKALLKLSDDFTDFDFDGKWRQIGNFHLKVWKWCQQDHFHLKVIEGYSGWISLKNFPLPS